MGKREKCGYCDELAVASITDEGRKISVCAYHLPLRERDKVPELRTHSYDAKKPEEP